MFEDIPDLFQDSLDFTLWEEPASCSEPTQNEFQNEFQLDTNRMLLEIQGDQCDKFFEVCIDFKDLLHCIDDECMDPFGNIIIENTIEDEEIPQEKEVDVEEIVEEIPNETNTNESTKKRRKPEKPKKPKLEKPKKIKIQVKSKVASKVASKVSTHSSQQVFQYVKSYNGSGFWNTLKSFVTIEIGPTPIPAKRFERKPNKPPNCWESVLEWAKNGKTNQWHSRGKAEEILGKESYHAARGVILNKPNSNKNTPEYPCLSPGQIPTNGTMLLGKFNGNWFFMYWNKKT